jgi:hypothetical protein
MKTESTEVMDVLTALQTPEGRSIINQEIDQEIINSLVRMATTATDAIDSIIYSSSTPETSHNSDAKIIDDLNIDGVYAFLEDDVWICIGEDQTFIDINHTQAKHLRNWLNKLFGDET